MFNFKQLTYSSLIFYLFMQNSQANIDPLMLLPTQQSLDLIKKLNQTQPLVVFNDFLYHEIDSQLIQFLSALMETDTISRAAQFVLLNQIKQNLTSFITTLNEHIEKYGGLCLVIISLKLPNLFNHLFTFASNASTEELTIKIPNVATPIFLPKYFRMNWQQVLFQALINPEYLKEIKLAACRQLNFQGLFQLVEWLIETKQISTDNAIVKTIIELFWHCLSYVKISSISDQEKIFFACQPLFELEPERFGQNTICFQKYFKQALSDISYCSAVPDHFINANPEYFLRFMLLTENSQLGSTFIRYKINLIKMIKQHSKIFFYIVKKEKVVINLCLLNLILKSNPKLVIEYEADLTLDEVEIEQDHNSYYLKKLLCNYTSFLMHLIRIKKININPNLVKLILEKQPQMIKWLHKSKRRTPGKRTWQRVRFDWEQLCNKFENLNTVSPQ